jgi:hypothetical protein
MTTFLTTPKPFRERIGVIQHDASVGTRVFQNTMVQLGGRGVGLILSFVLLQIHDSLCHKSTC